MVPYYYRVAYFGYRIVEVKSLDLFFRGFWKKPFVYLCSFRFGGDINECHFGKFRGFKTLDL
jgi:hypothetical protein